VAKPPAASDEALREHHRQVLLKFSISKGITIGQYRKELGQKLFHTQTRLSGFPQQSERLHPLSMSGISMIRPYRVASQGIATIEEGSEPEDERSLVNQHSPSRSKSGTRTQARTLPRRFLGRFLSHFKG